MSVFSNSFILYCARQLQTVRLFIKIQRTLVFYLLYIMLYFCLYELLSKPYYQNYLSINNKYIIRKIYT